MPDRAVAMRAVELFLVGANGQNLMHEIGVAVQAIVLHDPEAHVAHAYRFREILQSKTLGMPESISALV